ncbi:hypothetical protein B566_EDAN009790 [Ephemera danica]|nr:hypothetical protein B566_EDAN009790 [Ephemera danica]
MEQLQEECDRYWRAGRQMCEVPSLTGNPCTNPIHRATEEEEPCKEALTRDRVPTFPHSSGVRYVSACNCGRKQGPREDPFVLRTANCDFYAALAADCCSALENHYFPVFQPSVKNYQAARLLPSPQHEANTSRRESLRGDTTNRTPQFGFNSLVGTFFSGHSEGSEINTEEISRLSPHLLQHKDENNFPYCQHEIVIKITDTDSESSKDTGGIKLTDSSSTTEYLPGMLHTASPPGLLPQFPSWSLVCLGPSSLYSHNHGLTDQPGFLPGSGYLLPWDVTVRLEPTSDQLQTAVSNDIKWPLLGKPTMTSVQPHKQTNEWQATNSSTDENSCSYSKGTGSCDTSAQSSTNTKSMPKIYTRTSRAY